VSKSLIWNRSISPGLSRWGRQVSDNKRFIQEALFQSKSV
jgi:hypothetical protein